MAIASISVGHLRLWSPIHCGQAQSTHAVGAALNATFGSVVELLLYFTALQKGLGEMVSPPVGDAISADRVMAGDCRADRQPSCYHFVYPWHLYGHRWPQI